jgi:transcriptional regulator with XRE-family HTH domain
MLIWFDWKRFGADVRNTRRMRGLTLREMGSIYAVGISTISRLESHGKPCGVEALIALTLALDMNLFEYAVGTPIQAGGTPLSALAAS